MTCKEAEKCDPLTEGKQVNTKRKMIESVEKNFKIAIINLFKDLKKNMNVRKTQIGTWIEKWELWKITKQKF